ncbi:pilus assembly protein [Stakelama sp. CBK3Z-3]|uniref:Pilus assembly protein n=1 Tax=Stakelama flava TaxID=2860338 RepID=A0ABS6XGM0_9SPHN|nr:pilus assembly protein [Stakelama flava]MBW4329322.1 pilus assembly protein [Stakelama flava]
MTAAISRPLAVMAGLAREKRGLALIEFAFSLPILLGVALMGIETAHYAIAMMRVNQISTSVADNVARVRDSITEADVNEALLSANLIGDSIDFGERGRVVVSSVSPNGKTGSTAGQWIRWQRCMGALNVTQSKPQYGDEGTGKNNGALQYMGSSKNRITAADDVDMIFVEVTYQYKPVVGSQIIGEPILRSEASYTVRERDSEDLQSSTGVTAKTCDKYSAS